MSAPSSPPHLCAESEAFSPGSDSFVHDRDGLGAHHAYLLPVVERILGAPKERMIFEVGFGNGAAADYFCRKGFRVAGIEPSAEGVARARAAFPHLPDLQQGSIYDASPERFGRFPIVLSLEVIEHLYAPRKFVAACRSLCLPGGVLIVSTPYHGYLKNLAVAAFGKSDRHYDPLWDHGHIKFWSARTLSRLLSEGGFGQVELFRAGRIAPWAKSMVAAARRLAGP